MGVVYQYFTFNGKSSRDFEVWISGSGTFNAPRRDVESIAVPGRNGNLHIDNGRFDNIEITYPAFIVKAFRQNFDAFKAYMNAQSGYKVLRDSYHPEYYRKARFAGELQPEMTTLNREGTFDIVFDCDPRRFMISGEKLRQFTGETIMNPTLFSSKPLIRVYGTGTLRVNDISVVISNADEYTDINSEIEEAYKGSVNCNGNITLTDGEFPVLKPGSNSISYTGNRIDIAPNWWTV